MSVAFLFPGQGAQHTAMLHQLPRHTAVTATLEEASTVLHQDVSQLDSDEALQSTVTAQLALLIAGVAVARTLNAEESTPEMVAGLSVGAFSAVVTAGIIDFAAALHLVQLRGELMEQAYPQGYGMGAIIGLTEIQVNNLLMSVNTPATPVFLANVNAPRQIVVSGTEQAVQQALEQARKAGAYKVERLVVTTPSHCPLMAPIAECLSQEIARITLSQPSITYISSSNAREQRTPDSLRNDLAHNVARPVRWYDTTTVLFELGARLFIESLPGHVLTSLAAEAFPRARAVALENSHLSSVIALIQRKTK